MEHGAHWLFAPERSLRELADGLEALADPGRCRAMGAAGRQKIAELFDAEKNTGVLEEVFRARLNGRRS